MAEKKPERYDQCSPAHTTVALPPLTVDNTASYSSKLPIDPSSTNPRGIPVAPFVDDVSDYISSRADVESTLRSFQEMISKYQFMQINTQRRGQGLKDKIPDIRKTLETVGFLRNRRKVSM